MDWRVKACIQGVLSKLPAGAHLNNLLQTMVGGRADQSRHIDLKFQADWLVLMKILREQEFEVRDKVLLEIGTGWLPVLPLCFALVGARHIHSYDMNRHLLPQTAAKVLRQLKPKLCELAHACGQPLSELESRHAWLSAVTDGSQILRRAGIQYHAPADASMTGLSAGAVDLVFSNSVLEHVNETQLVSLMRESARLLSHSGLVLHSINCADHYAYFDRSISSNHYLRFTKRQWRRWNNKLLFQNRLRPKDFTDAAGAAGLRVTHTIRTVRQDLLANLRSTPIAPEFAHYSDDELCSTSITFSAQRFRFQT